MEITYKKELWSKATGQIAHNRVGGVIGKFDVSSFDNNYLRQHRGDYQSSGLHLACFFFFSVDVYVIEGKRNTPGTRYDR